MAEEWLSYAELGERLGVSPEAARQKAIRARWPRQTANDGKTQVRVDVEDLLATMPARRPKDEEPDDEGPTPVEPPSDGQTFAALEAHIATLKDMVARADELTGIERQRAFGERMRAEEERQRADRERARADELAGRLDAVREAGSEDRALLRQQLADLRARIEAMSQPRPWWKRLAG